MELSNVSRRGFVRTAVGAACLLAAGVHAGARQACSVAGDTAGKCLRALKPHRYPGKVRSLDDTAVRTRGRWRG